MYWDLNIPWQENNIKLKDTVGTAVKYGFGGVAINNEVKQPDLNIKHECPIPLLNLNFLWTAGEEVVKQLQRLQLLGQGNVGIRWLRRITIELRELQEGSQLVDLMETLRQYDLIAIRPTNADTFQQVCQQLDVDIISINFVTGGQFKIRPSLVKEAVQRGVVFEIAYEALLEVDAEFRKQAISRIEELVQITNGKGIVLSSGAPTSDKMRGREEVVSIGNIFGMNEKRAREAISTTCNKVIERSRKRRSLNQMVVYKQQTSQYSNVPSSTTQKRKQKMELIRQQIKARRNMF